MLTFLLNKPFVISCKSTFYYLFSIIVFLSESGCVGTMDIKNLSLKLKAEFGLHQVVLTEFGKCPEKNTLTLAQVQQLADIE